MRFDSVKCKTLLGHRNLDFSIACLHSFIHSSSENIQLQIFEDGSLTEEDAEKLLSHVRGSTIIYKKDRDAWVAEKLAAFPNCGRYRNNSIYAQKLFDVMLFDEDDLLFIDSDVYFIRKFQMPGFKEQPFFMTDYQNAYSFGPLEFLKIKHPIFPRINSGFFYFPNSLFSLGFIETLLGDPFIAKGRAIVWLEQTIWAFLAARYGAVRYLDKNQIVVAREKLHLNRNTIAVHLVSSFRYHFDRLKRLSPADTHEAGYREVRAYCAQSYLQLLAFSLDKVRKRMKRHVNSLRQTGRRPGPVAGL